MSVYHTAILKKLSVACNKVFESLMGVARYCSASALFVSMNVSSFLVLRQKLVYSFLTRMLEIIRLYQMSSKWSVYGLFWVIKLVLWSAVVTILDDDF